MDARHGVGTFIVGWLAIAGIFPLAGFWSKDEILASVWSTDNYVLWGIGVVTALLTAFYMTRQVWLVFYGNERWNENPRLARRAGRPGRRGAARRGCARRSRARARRGDDRGRDADPHDEPRPRRTSRRG